MPRTTSRTNWAKSWAGRNICVSVRVVSPTGPSVVEMSAGKRAIQPCRMSSATTPLMSVFKSYWRVFSFAFAIADS